MSATNYKYLETRETLNKDGVIEQTETIKSIKIPKEEDYIKLYIKHINYLNNLPQGLDPLIYCLLEYVTYGNKIVINSSIKRAIAQKLNKEFNTINQYMTKLVKHDILIREDRGVYILNPALYGKGKWEDIIKLRKELELNITYKDDSYTITHKNKNQPKLPGM